MSTLTENKSVTLADHAAEAAEDVVLVVGSKPKITIPAFHFSQCYCANAAVLRVQNLPKCTKIISVLSRDYAMDYREVITSNLDRMIGARINEAVLIGALPFQSVSPALRNVLRSAPVKKLRSFYRTSAVIRVIGWSNAWKLMRARTGTLSTIVRLLSKQEHMGIKPSTGLYAVLLAFERHPHAEIHVSGIGLDPDGVFTDSGSKGRSHIPVDRLLVEWLIQSGRVHFHDL
jgi:hypothetical protein